MPPALFNSLYLGFYFRHIRLLDNGSVMAGFADVTLAMNKVIKSNVMSLVSAFKESLAS